MNQITWERASSTVEYAIYRAGAQVHITVGAVISVPQDNSVMLQSYRGSLIRFPTVEAAKTAFELFLFYMPQQIGLNPWVHKSKDHK